MSNSRQILMPKLGLTMTEGVLTEWKVAPGDRISAGEVIFVVETDKIANDVEAQQDGVIEALLAEPGDVVPVGGAVASLAVEGGHSAGDEAAAQPEVPAEVSQGGAQPRIIATPLARRMAAASGLDLAKVSGSGPRGRIMAEDVRLAQGSGDASVALPEAPRPVAKKPSPTRKAQLRELGQFQKVAARRLTESKQNIPHFYVFAEADVTGLLELRSQLNDGSGHAKLTVSHFLIAAVARAVEAVPQMNCVWAGDALRELPTVDVGLAVESPKGLVAPVLQDFADLTLDEIATAANALVERARAGKLSGGELEGGAITISNVGMFGATGLLPIINPGQSSILGVGASQPVFRPDDNGQPVLRQVLNLALSCDHRVVDGALAARFLQIVSKQLEAAANLLRRPLRG